MKNTDIALIHRTLNGDDNAFAELVKKYQKQVHALVWRKIGDFHTAEEITQDVFLKAYQRLAKLKKPQSFASWLYVIAANDCSTWLRKKRLKTQPLEATSGVHLEKATYSGYVISENERTSAEAQRDAVQKLLAKLQESERTVITLFYFAEMTCKEISEFLGVSANTIKSRLSRARHRLKKEEPMIREALDHFQITPHLTENIMREIARIKPIAPSGNKPFIPWAIAASTMMAVLILLGIGSYQYAIRFQQPYSFDASSEMTVDILETPLVLNLVSKPDARTQIETANAGKDKNSEQRSNEAQTPADEAQAEAFMKHYSKWELPRAAKMRLGKGGINDMQFSPDGSQLAVGNDMGTWLYDMKTGKEIALFPGICESLAFSPDGRFLAKGGFGKLWGEEPHLWEIATRRKVPFTDAPRPATALRFSEDGKTLISVDSWGATISRLDIETGEKDVTTLEGQPDSLGHIIEVYTFTHDSVAGGKVDGKIRLWDTTTGKKLTTLNGHAVEDQDPLLDTHVLTLAFSPDGTQLASGSTDTTVRLWDTVIDRDEPVILRKHTGWVNALAFSPDGKMLASGSTDKTVQLWNTATGEHLATLTGHLSGIAALTFSPDGSTLASGSTDGTIRFWDTETGDELSNRITGHTQWVKAGTFLKDSSTFVSVAFNGTITFWALETSEKNALQMAGDRDLLRYLAFSLDGTKLASVDTKGDIFFAAGFGHSISTPPRSDAVIRITDVKTGRELTKTYGAGQNLAFSPDKKKVAFDHGVSIRLWDTETGKTLEIFLVDPTNETDVSSDNIIAALTFSPDGKKLASGTWGGDLQIWNSETGEALNTFLRAEPQKGHHGRDTIRTLAFSPDGAMLAVGSDTHIRIRLLEGERQIGFKNVRGQTEVLVFSPDATVLAIGRRNGGIELWDITTGDQLTTLEGHTGPVETLIFSPDGRTLVSTGQDGTILVWDWDEALKNTSNDKNMLE